jgi:hypothetical protein
MEEDDGELELSKALEDEENRRQWATRRLKDHSRRRFSEVTKDSARSSFEGCDDPRPKKAAVYSTNNGGRGGRGNSGEGQSRGG